jgi:hypothetical protein
VLLELRDDMIGDSEPLLLRQPRLETADDSCEHAARHRQWRSGVRRLGSWGSENTKGTKVSQGSEAEIAALPWAHPFHLGVPMRVEALRRGAPHPW